MARNLGTLEYLVDIDTSGVYAGAAEVEAVLKGIPDEKVNLEIDTNVESLRKARSELVKYQKALKAAMTAGGGDLDKRTKAYKALPAELKQFIDKVGGAEEAMLQFSVALDHNASRMSEWTYLQRRASDMADKARRATNDQVKAQEKQIVTTRKEAIETAKLEERIAKLNTEIAKRERSPLAQNTELERRQLARMRTEVQVLSSRLAELGGDVDGVNQRYDEHSDRLAQMLKGMSKVRLNLGFFSLNVGQLAAALTVLAPILSGLVGGFAALAGAVGSALVGAFGLAAAAGGGLLLSLIGIGTAVKPLVDELKTAAKAAIDYQKQVLKTGKNSEEAQDKLEDYRNTVKNLPADTQKLIAESGKLYTEWSKLTDALRRPFFETAGVGIQTLGKLMPVFKSETKSAFTTVAAETQKLLKGLGSLEGQRTIQTLMQNNTRAMPGFIQGLGAITTAIGRLAVASSRHLPRISRTFQQWSQGLADSTGQTEFQNRVDEMMSQLTGVGRVLTASGRLLITFFSAGATAGKAFTTQLTNTINRWTNWMKSTEGQESLAQFFKDSITELTLLYRAISPIIKVFARWTEATRPLSQAFLRFVGVLSTALEIFTRIPGMIDLIVVGMSAFTGRKILLGITGLIKGYRAVRAAILGVAAAQTAAAAASATAARANAAAAATSGLGMAGGATATKAATAGVAVRGAATGALTAGRGLLAFLGGPWGIGISLAVTGLILFGDKLLGLIGNMQTFGQQVQSIKSRQTAATNAIRNAGPALDQARTSYKELKDSVAAYNNAVSEGKRPEQSLGDIEKQSAQVVQNQKDAANSLIDYIDNLQSARGEARNLVKDQMSLLLQPGAMGKGGGATFGAAGDEVAALNRLLDSGTVPSATKVNKILQGLKIPSKLRTAIDTWLVTGFERAGAKVNVLRTDLGKTALPPRLTQQVGQLFSDLPKRARGDLTAAFAQMEPEAVRQTSGLLQRLTSAGKTRAAIKLAAKIDPKNADQGIRAIQQKLKQFDLPSKKVKLSAEPTGFNKTLKSVTGSPGKKDIKLGVSNLDQIKSTLQGWVDDTPTKNIKITPQLTTDTVTVNVKKVPVKAEGGMIGTAKQEGSRTQGGRFAAPTFLVGEENRPEYVIATNPAYRRNNIEYWMEAGMALGIPGFAGGGATAAGKPPKKPTATGNSIPSPPGNWRRAGYDKLKNFFIPWSENETDATARIQERLLSQGISKDYPAQIKDIDRSIAMYKRLQNLLDKKMQGKKNIIKDKKTGKDKRKQAKSDLNAMKKEYFVDNRQALSNLRLDRAELKAESTTGAGFAVNPFLTEMLTYTQSQYQLGQQYGSNMLGGAAAISGANVTAAGGTPSTRSGGPGAAGGRSINITNNYQEPPADPHTWSKQLAWEVGVG